MDTKLLIQHHESQIKQHEKGLRILRLIKYNANEIEWIQAELSDTNLTKYWPPYTINARRNRMKMAGSQIPRLIALYSRHLDTIKP
jgi:hypothetical protein